MRPQTCAVYILANRPRGVLYTGVTSDLQRRLVEHRMRHDPSSFIARYNLDLLAYFETTPDIRAAIEREKQVKRWLRQKKIALIESVNPEWQDLASGWDAQGIRWWTGFFARLRRRGLSRCGGILRSAPPRSE